MYVFARHRPPPPLSPPQPAALIVVATPQTVNSYGAAETYSGDSTTGFPPALLSPELLLVANTDRYGGAATVVAAGRSPAEGSGVGKEAYAAVVPKDVEEKAEILPVTIPNSPVRTNA